MQSYGILLRFSVNFRHMEKQYSSDGRRQLKNIRKNLTDLENGKTFHMVMQADTDQLSALSSTSLWIVHNIACKNISFLDTLLDEIHDISPGCAAALCGNDLLVYPIGGINEKEIKEKSQELSQYLKVKNHDAILLECPDLQGTKAPSYLYEISIGCIHDAQIIYPHAPYLTMQKIRFARMVRLIMQNEHLLAIYTGVIQFLEKMDPHGRPCIFLCAYYLDCCCDIMRTASMLYLHRNTVKYRIHKISTLLGYDISDSNESMNLIVACAVSRLHNAEKMSKKF